MINRKKKYKTRPFMMTVSILCLLGGLFTAVYVGWILDRKVVHEQLTNGGRIKGRMEPFLIFCLRYVAPVSIFFIFLYLTGII